MVFNTPIHTSNFIVLFHIGTSFSNFNLTSQGSHHKYSIKINGFIESQIPECPTSLLSVSWVLLVLIILTTRYSNSFPPVFPIPLAYFMTSLYFPYTFAVGKVISMSLLSPFLGHPFSRQTFSLGLIMSL